MRVAPLLTTILLSLPCSSSQETGNQPINTRAESLDCSPESPWQQLCSLSRVFRLLMLTAPSSLPDCSPSHRLLCLPSCYRAVDFPAQGHADFAKILICACHLSAEKAGVTPHCSWGKSTLLGFVSPSLWLTLPASPPVTSTAPSLPGEVSQLLAHLPSTCEQERKREGRRAREERGGEIPPSPRGHTASPHKIENQKLNRRLNERLNLKGSSLCAKDAALQARGSSSWS